MSSRTASCSCGQLRIQVEGEPRGVGICHCLAFKRFTSSTAETGDDIEPIIERILAATPDSPVRFVLESEGSREFVATAGSHTVSSAIGTAEVTYDVAPWHWGKGIASAACRAASRWGFEGCEERGWHRIQATTLPPNVASQKVLERCGFQREGLVRNFRLVRGMPADYWLYSVIPGEVRGAA